jgi:hypothetical protein
MESGARSAAIHGKEPQRESLIAAACGLAMTQEVVTNSWKISMGATRLCRNLQ